MAAHLKTKKVSPGNEKQRHFKLHLKWVLCTLSSREQVAKIVSSHLHCEGIRGPSTHTHTNLFTVTQPYVLCHDPHQHVSNLTVAFGISGKPRGTKRVNKYPHTLFTVKKCHGGQCLDPGADRWISGAGIDGNCCKNNETDVHLGWVRDPLREKKGNASSPGRWWMQGGPKQPPGVETWKGEFTRTPTKSCLYLSKSRLCGFYLWVSHAVQSG